MYKRQDCYSSSRDIVLAIKKSSESSEKKELSSEQSRLLRHHIAALDGPLSYERIVDALNEHRDSLRTDRNPVDWTKGLYAQTLRNFSRRRRKASRNTRGNRHYIAHKFSGITEADVAEKISALRAIRPELPDVSILPRSEGIFELRRRGEP